MTVVDAREEHQSLPAAAMVNGVKLYGESETQVRALDDVSIQFSRGQMTAIMGPSGSGKSTLMHCLAALDDLNSGQVWLGDVELSGLNERQKTKVRREKIGFIFQAYNLAADADRPRRHRATATPRRPWT